MPRCPILALLVLAACPLAGNPPAAADDLAHTEELLRTLGELKVQIAAIQARIDEITRQLSERKGALASRPAGPPPPPPFGGVLSNHSLQSDQPDRPAAKPAPRRCAAITRAGDRCSRSASANSRYCRQHALAKMR